MFCVPVEALLFLARYRFAHSFSFTDTVAVYTTTDLSRGETCRALYISLASVEAYLPARDFSGGLRNDAT
jgi:hypothetical protein